VQHLLKTAGVRVVQTPFRAPNCNAYAERFVRTINEECLNKVIPLGGRHLRRTLAEFVAHYHGERNHQGLGNELIDRCGGSLPAAAFVAGSDSAEF
jgi:transposase InsO family protein